MFGKSEHLIGQLVSPETAPATKNTVQVDFTERLTPGTESFGLAKLRGRILWQAGSRHIIRFHRQMPKGWPEPPHVETDESAFTGRTAPILAPAPIQHLPRGSLPRPGPPQDHRRGDRRSHHNPRLAAREHRIDGVRLGVKHSHEPEKRFPVSTSADTGPATSPARPKKAHQAAALRPSRFGAARRHG